MTETIADKVVEFDPSHWTPEQNTDPRKEIFSESDAIEAAARLLSEKGIEIWTIWHAHDIAIEYAGKREYISLGLVRDSATAALMEAMQEISCAIDTQDGIECYIGSKAGRYFFHIRKTETEAA